MSAQTRQLGSNTYTFWDANAAGRDLVSSFSFPSTGAPLTGSLTATTVRPIRVSSFSIYFRSGSAGSVDFQLATSNTGSGGYQSAALTASSGTKTVTPNIAKFTGDLVYYGLEKNDGSEVRIWRGGTDNGGLWSNGTKLTDYPSAGIYGSISWQTVPNLPTALAAGSITTSGLTLSWTAPTDNGGTAINGYRILYKETSSSTWLVAVADTGSTDLSYEITELDVETSYDFRVAALNAVTDVHNATYTEVSAHTGTNSDVLTVSTLPSELPVWVDNTLGTFYQGVPYSDGVEATNADAYQLLVADSLPAGISLDTSTGAVTGTPTTLGPYSFTIQATNAAGFTGQPFTGEVISATGGSGAVKVRSGEAWVDGTLHVYDGTEWIAASVFVRSGDEWVEST